MIKTKLALGFALIACVLVSSAAAASASEFRGFKGATEIKGVAVAGTLKQGGEQKFTIGTGIAVVCTELSGSSSANKLPSLSFKTPFSYTGCKAKVSGVSTTATVTSTGCEYTFFTAGSVTVGCGTGSIVITAGSLCTIKVGTQEGLKKITYTPLETKSATLTGTAAVTGIKQENSCGITGEVSYNGVAVVTPEAGVTLEIK